MFRCFFPFLLLICSFHLSLTHSENMGSLGNMTDVRGAGWRGEFWWRSVELQTHTSGVAQCRYPRRITWRAQLYVWRNKYQINFNVFSCLPLSSFLKSVYCFLMDFSYRLCFFVLFIPLYKKQTAPMSTPNSWSAPPTSMGAMSTIGSLDVFWVLYSITVLPHWPVCFCGGKEKCKGTVLWR